MSYNRHILYIVITLLTLLSVEISAQSEPYFPVDIALSGRSELYIANKGNKRVDVYSEDAAELKRTILLDETPTGLAVKGDVIYVTTMESIGKLWRIDALSGKVLSSVVTGSGACSPCFNRDNSKLYICNQFSNTISEIDPDSGEVLRTVDVLREPRSMVITPDGKYLYSTNFLPAQRADLDYVAAAVSVIDLDSFTKVKDIRLTNGSNAVRGICITPDGKYVYVSHNLGRYSVPTSQLQQGWMNTSAFSIIDVASQEFLGSVVVDDPERGAAGIWGIVCDQERIYISHSGTHDISVIEHNQMREKFENYPQKDMLDYDLTFLYGIRERIPIVGNGPRKIVLADGKVYIPTYFADVLNILDVESRALTSHPLNPARKESMVEMGERIFNDAANCFQNWQSCNGCHPGEGRTDGMNWDLMNDAVGNPKNCKSMLFSHISAPCMISGIRESAELAVRAGFKFIQFFDVSEEDAICVDEYLKSLKPVPSPYLVNGELSEKAKAGEKIFAKLKCGECHSGVLYTDRKKYRIGDDIEFPDGWDTPTLREVWRTAPYLFDGRAATMQDVFKEHKHGIDKKKLSDKEIDELAEYVNSL